MSIAFGKDAADVKPTHLRTVFTLYSLFLRFIRTLCERTKEVEN